MATLTEFLTGIADALRKKKGTSGPIPAQNFAAEIESIQTGTDTSDATATTGDILSGKTAYGASGKLTGTIPTVEQATPQIYLSSGGLITSSSSQEAGYVAGGTKEATLQLKVQDWKTITPGTTEQTAVAPRTFTTGEVLVLGDANLLPKNIKSGVSIFGVTGTLKEGVYRAVTYDLVAGGTAYTVDDTGRYWEVNIGGNLAIMVPGIVVVHAPYPLSVSVSSGSGSIVKILRGEANSTIAIIKVTDRCTISTSN